MASSARIDELRKKFDENPRRYFAPLANEYRKAGDLEQAIFICQEYLPQQPGHMSGHIVYGQALFELSRLDEARQVFETALSLDPENLIALRHLGDISRQTGDSRGARSWYQRVLEADPRNEEIAQIMMTLLATPDAAMLAVDGAAAPLATPAVQSEGVDDATRATDPIGFTPTDIGFQVEKSEDRSGLAVGPELSALPERQETPPATPVFTSREQIPESELLDLNDFSIGGIPMTELGMSPSIDEPPSQEHRTEEAPVVEETTDEEVFTESPSAFVADSVSVYDAPIREEPAPEVSAASVEEPEFSIEKEIPPFESEFEADPYAIAAAPIQPVEELASDITLGLSDDGKSPSLAAPGDDAMPGLESFDHGIVPPPGSTPAIEFESFFTVPPAEPESPLNIGVGESDAVTAEADVEPPLDEIVVRFETPPVPVEAQEEPVAWSLPLPAPIDEPLAEPEPVFEAAPEPEAEPEPISAWSMPQPEPEIEPELEPELETLFEAEPVAAWPTPIEMEPEPESAPDLVVAWSAPVEMEPELEPAPDLVTAWVAPVEAQPEIEIEIEEPATAPEAFVTETMAELYLQQGHVEAALGIYQKLVEQRPFDVVLQDRLRLLEEEVHGKPEPEVDLAEEPLAAPSAVTGPTIRDFLSGIVRTVAGSMAAISAQPVMPAYDESFDVPLTDLYDAQAFDETIVESISDAPALDDVLVDAVLGDEPVAIEDAVASGDVLPSIDSEFGDEPEPAPPMAKPLPTPAFGTEIRPARGTPAIPGETVSGSIDALFSGADASTTDSKAADTLAQAFAPEGPETKPLQGIPAHKASSELSLDRVFKTLQPSRPEAEGEGFSFDQFFAEDAGDTAGKTGDSTSSGGQAPDDIAQFNNWLNGLKKT